MDFSFHLIIFYSLINHILNIDTVGGLTNIEDRMIFQRGLMISLPWLNIMGKCKYEAILYMSLLCYNNIKWIEILKIELNIHTACVFFSITCTLHVASTNALFKRCSLIRSDLGPARFCEIQNKKMFNSCGAL